MVFITLQITDVNGCTSEITSTTIEITDGQIQPILTANGPTCENESITLEIAQYTGNSVTYTWRKNGNLLPSNNNNQLILNPVSILDIGAYEVTVEVDGCTIISNQYQLEVYEQPTTSIANVASMSCVTGAEELELIAMPANGVAPYTYVWSGNGFTSTDSIAILTNISNANSGTYTLQITDSNGCISDIASTEVDITDGIEEPILTTTGTVCEGGQIILSVQNYTGNNVLYQWEKDGNPIVNINNELIINPVTVSDIGEYSVMVTVDGCSANSDTIQLDVFEQPTTTIEAVAPITCVEGSEELNLTSLPTNGVYPYSYAWSGPNGFTSADSVATILNITSSASGNYTLQITDSNGCVSEIASTEVDITDGIAEPILTTTGTVCEGGQIILGVQNYTGNSVLYQWEKDGNPIVNINNELIINPVTTADIGEYSVIVTVDGCSANSDTIQVDVFEQPTTTIENVAPMTCVTGSEELELVALPTNGVAPYTYLWSGNGFTSTDSIATLTNISSANSGTYTLQITDSNGCTSEIASTEVDITDGIEEPILTTTGAVCEGGQITLSVQNYVGNSVLYQWEKDGNPIVNINNELIINPVTVSDIGEYSVMVTVDGCSANSDTIQVNVFEQPTTTIEAVVPITCVEGSEELNLTSLPTNGVYPYSYAWSGPNGFTSADSVATILNITSAASGNYTLQITDSNGCVSDIASIEVDITDGIDEPILTTTGTVCEGGQITLAVQNYVGNNVLYSWEKDGNPIININNELIINPVTVSDIGEYSVMVTVDGCSANSDTIQVDVFEEPTTTIEAVAPITCIEGSEELNLTSLPTNGLEPYTYSWSGPNGFTSTDSVATILNITSAASGNYTLQITDSNGCVSEIASIEVDITDGIEEPILTTTGTVCEGGQITLSVQNYVGTSVLYQWEKDGNPITNINNELIINPVTTADIGEYSVIVIVDGCSANSDTIQVEVFEQPTTTIEAVAPITCVEGSEELNLTSLPTNGVAPYTYLWSGPNGFTSTDSVATILNITSAASGNYTLQITDSNGCVSEIASTEADITDGIEEPILTTTGTVCEGGQITLSIQNYTGNSVLYSWEKDGNPIVNINNELIINPVTTADIGEYSVIVTVDGCSTNSDTIDVDVFEQPTTTIVNVAPMTCVTGSEELELVALPTNGVAPYTYLWSGNGFTSTDSIATLTNITTANSGTYTLQITDVNGCTSEITSTTVDITDGIAEPILTTTGAVCEGGQITLSVQNYVGTSVLYQWEKDGNPIININNELIINPVTREDIGEYSVTVTVDGCSANSDTIQLDVFEQPQTMIETVVPITCVEGSEELNLTSLPTNGVYPYSYAWSGPNGFTSTDSVATILNITSAASGNYILQITDSNGCVSEIASTEADITDGIAEPILTTTGAVCEGGQITLSVQNYVGTSVLYQWEKDGNPIININNELIINPVTREDIGEYSVTVTVDGCSANSDTIQLDVFEQPQTMIETVVPITCVEGSEELNLTSLPTNGVYPYSYAWSGPNGFTSTDSVATILNITSAASGNYILQITDSNGCVSEIASTEADITDGIAEPILTTTGAVCEGGQITLSVQNYVGTSVLYQWGKDGNPIININNELIINPVTIADIGEYSVIVTVDGCSANSDTIDVDVFEQPTTTIEAVAPIACVEGSEELNLTSLPTNGVYPYSYAWSGPNGFTSTDSVATILNITSAASGNYTLQITDSNGCISEIASTEVDITDGIEEPILTTTGAVCEGGQITLSVQNYVGNSVLYQWEKDGNPIVNINNELIINPVTVSDIGEYSVIVIVDGCSANSDTIDVDVFEQPTTTIAAVAPITCVEGSEELNLTSLPTNGVYPYSYAWSGSNGFTSTDSVATILNITSAASGNYTLQITDSNGCTSEIASTEVDITDGIAEPILTTTGAVCEGGQITLSVQNYVGNNVLYQWEKDGNPIVNINNELIINPVTVSDIGEYSVIVTVDGCSANSDTIQLDVFEQPTTTIVNVASMSCVTGAEELELIAMPANGVAPYTYAWIGNGFTSTDSIAILTNISSANSGTYTLQVTDSNGCTSEIASTEVDITDGIAEPILTTTGTVCEGGQITLSVQNYVGTSVLYQWEKDGNPITNINNELIINPVTTADIGEYSVMVTVDGCSANSDTIQVDVFEQPQTMIEAVAPITCVEGSEELNLTSLPTNGVYPYSYAWSGPNGFTSTDSVATILNITSAASGNYILQITDSNGCVSEIASTEVDITDGIAEPILTTTGAVCEGGQITLSVQNYVGTSVLYQWGKDGNPIINTNNELIINPVTIADIGEYSVIVTVDGCSANSDTIQVDVFEQPTTTIEAVAPITCVEGSEELNLTSLPTNGVYPYSYAWSGPNGFTSTDSVAAILNITSSASGNYTLQITDSNGCVSEIASTEVDITDGIAEPILTTTGAVCEGGQITLSVQNYLGNNVLYQWEKDGNPIVNINNELIINPVTIADIGEYSVIVTVDGCSANSDTIQVDVFEQPTTSIANVAPMTCVTGAEELELIALPANGVAPYTYAWSGNGFISTDSIAMLTNISSANSGTYTLQITDSNGCISDIASREVDITDGIAEPILTTTGAVCEGGQITLSVQNYVGNSVLYQWEKDGNPIVNINNELIINPVTVSDIGEYSVIVTVDGCSANSDTIQVDVFEQPTTSIANVAPMTCVTGSEELELIALPANGIAPYTYAWIGNGFTSTDSIAMLTNINSANSGTYTLQITDANGCKSEIASTEVDITDGIAEPILTTTGAVCEGGQITLSVQNYTGNNVLYQWGKDGNPIININNELIINPVTIADIGEYSVIVTVDGCSANSDTIQLDVFEQPTTTIANVAPMTCVTGSEELELIALPANGIAPYTYAWIGNGFTSTDSIAMLTNINSANSGTYTLQITDANGCKVKLPVQKSI